MADAPSWNIPLETKPAEVTIIGGGICTANPALAGALLANPVSTATAESVAVLVRGNGAE